MKLKRRTKFGLTLLAVAVMLLLVTRFVVSPYVVFGQSMSPTLESWDLCLMAKVREYQPRRGEIVMFRTSDDPPLYFVKRVVALPGETIEIESGVVRVNNEPLSEPYTTINPGWDMETTNLSPSKIFVLGDNRDLSQDSYVYGVVAKRLVLARLLGSWRWKR